MVSKYEVEKRESLSQSPLEQFFQERLHNPTISAFEERICEQFQKLPLSLATLQQPQESGGSLFEEAYKKSGLEKKKDDKRARKFYKALVVGLYRKEATREVFLDEMQGVFERKSAELLDADSIRKKVAIIGGGGSGLTVARTLIDKGMDPQDLIVVEAGKRLGGVFVSDVPEFRLINPAQIQGDEVLVQPKDFSSEKIPTNTEYADAVLCNAFFNKVEVVFQTKWVDGEDGISMLLRDDNTSEMSLLASGEENKTLIADKVVLAHAGMGDALYGEYSFAIQGTRKAEAYVGERIFNATGFLAKLAELTKAVEKGEDEKGIEMLALMLENNLAIVGAGKSAELFVHTLDKVLSYFDRTGQLQKIADKIQNSKIFIYDSRASREGAVKALQGTCSARMQRMLNYSNTNFQPIAKVTWLDAGLRDTIRVTSTPILTQKPVSAIEVGMVAFTGYSPQTFWQAVWRIKSEGGAYIFPHRESEIRLDITHHDKAHRVYATWPAKFIEAVSVSDRYEEKSRGNINRDSKIAADIAEDIWEQLHPVSSKRRILRLLRR